MAGRAAARRDAYLQVNNHARRVDIEVTPLSGPESQGRYFLVVFNEIPGPPAGQSGMTAATDTADGEIQSSNEELETAKEKLLNLIDTDIGRPVSDIKPNIEVPGFQAMLTTAMDDAETRETEAGDNEGRWYSVLVPDKDLRVVSASTSYLDTFEVTEEETLENLVYRLGNGQWAIPGLRERLRGVIDDDRELDGLEVTYDFEHIGTRSFKVSGRRIRASQPAGPIVLMQIEEGDGGDPQEGTRT